MEQRDVVIVGGGPAGAALATRLARRGHDVVVLERSPEPRWRACGVFSSPASVAALRRLGLDEPVLRTLTRAIPAMRVETPDGTRFRLTYGDDGSLHEPAVGFDRPAVDGALLELARAAGATVHMATTVLGVRAGRVAVRGPAGEAEIETRLVVGADGIRSTVARSFGVARQTWLGDRVGFLDPFTGEGLHRTLVSARLAAVAVDRHFQGDPDGLPAYDRAMSARFRAKDAVSLLVQAFLGQPVLFEFAARRLAARAGVRETMGLVMG